MESQSRLPEQKSKATVRSRQTEKEQFFKEQNELQRSFSEFTSRREISRTGDKKTVPTRKSTCSS